MTMEGYDVDVLQEISSDLYCVICLKLMRNPVQFKCGHGMCYCCFTTLTQKSKAITKQTITQCPQCREVVKEKEVVSNMMLHRLILSLKVNCKNYQEGCTWCGELDTLDEHLEYCTKVLEPGTELVKRKKKKITKDKESTLSQQIPSIESDVLLEITGQLSLLHDKIEQLEDDRETKTSHTKNNRLLNEKGNGSRGENTGDIIDEGRHNSSSIKELILKIIPKSGKHLIKSLVLCVSIFLCFSYALPMLWIDSMGSEDFPPLDMSNLENALKQIYYLLNVQQNNFFQLHQVSKELRADVDAQKLLFQDYLQLFWDTISHDVRYRMTLITDEIDTMVNSQLNDVSILEKRLDQFLQSVEREFHQQNTTLRNMAIQSLVVPNATDIDDPMDPIKRIEKLRNHIYMEVDRCEYMAIHTAKEKFILIKKKFSLLQNTAINFRSRYENSPLLNRPKQERSLKDEIFDEAYFDKRLDKQFLTQHIERLNKNYFLLRDGYQEDIKILSSKYNSTLFSYQTRFQNAMSTIQNTDLKNGKYVWFMNSTMMPNLPEKHGYFSREFTALPSFSPYVASKVAKLWLLRMSTESGYWKITYEQEDSSTDVNVQIAILNQKKEHDLKGIEVHRQMNDNKNPLIIDFKIPLLYNELIEQGYIYNNKVFIRCLVKPAKKAV